MFIFIAVISLIYFVGGASVGAVTTYILHRDFHPIFHEDVGMTWAMTINLVLLPCLVLLWRQGKATAPARLGLGASMSMLFLHRVPFNKRMAFLLFAIVWLIGLVVFICNGPQF